MKSITNTIIAVICFVLLCYSINELYADHGDEHGPGWYGSNCHIQPWQEDQGVICNMMGLENKILEHHDYKIWEFDDSYKIMYKNQEVLQWDCILNDSTSNANRFFCAVMMDYDYERLESYDIK